MKRVSPPLTLRQRGWAGACVIATIASHMGHLPPLEIALTTVILGVTLFVWRRGSIVAGWAKVPLVLALVAVVVLRYGTIMGREPGAALACGMLSLKLLETRVQRDARSVVCFSSFVLMSALMFTASLGATLLIGGLTPVLLMTLRELQPASHRESGATRWRRRLREVASSFGLALPLAICAFVFLPRLDAPLWRTSGEDIVRSGLSDTMTPSGMQNLLLDDSPALRAQFEGPPPLPRQLYWRGPVLSQFDGITWRRDPVAALRSTDQADLQTTGDLISYSVTMEPTNAPWLFALDAPVEVSTDATRDHDLTWIRRHPSGEITHYQSKSALSYRLSAMLSDRERRHALALPAGFNPRTRSLGAEWRNTLGSDEAVIAKALRWFREEFTYALTVPELGRDGVDDFLFNVKRGFCEHYAGAFVVLMRAAGIPARVVTGYQGGYYNPRGKYLLVRQSDAHAWAEIWRPDRGWVRIDPTAAVSPQRVELGASGFAAAGASWYQADWIRALRNQIDTLNEAWSDAIVQFNALRQRDLFQAAGLGAADLSTLTWLLIGTSSVLLLAAAAWVGRRPRIHRDRLDGAYLRLCERLARGGVSRAGAEGPTAFAARVDDAAARALLAEYVQLRYAMAEPDASRVAAFTANVRRWRMARRTPRGAAKGMARTGS